MNWIGNFVKGIQDAYERFSHEQTPLTLLFGNARKENEFARDQREVATIIEGEVAGEMRNVVAAMPGTRLCFDVRLPVSAKVSSWVALGSGKTSGCNQRIEFSLGVKLNRNLFILSRRVVLPPRTAGRVCWHRISADLSQFAGRELSIVLQTSAGPTDEHDHVAFWGNPRLLRTRSWREKKSKIGVRLSVGGLPALLTTFLQSFKDHPGTGITSAAYWHWIDRHSLTSEDMDRVRRRILDFRYRPLISVITPVYDTDSQYLSRCIESVRGQLYPYWELSIFDDGSTKLGVRDILRKYASLDCRIRVKSASSNLGISLASNAALENASGEYVAFLDHDDELAPEALFEVAALIQEHPEADIIYSDEDKLELDGTRSEPFFKPDWSPEYLLSCMYTSHLGVYRRELVTAVGGFRPGFEGCQDYDLMLRLVEKTQRIFHIPKVLYHWRKVLGSTAGDADAKPYKTEAARRALEEHTRRRGLPADVLNTDRPHTFRVKFKLVAKPLVSILIPCRDGTDLLRDCLKSIEEKTAYPCYEIIIIDNDSSTPEMRSFLANLKHRVISFPGPFNFSGINNLAARHAGGDHLIFLNNDTRVISPEWISALLEFTQQNEIGIAGAKLYYPDGRIQHAGVILGLHGVAGHSHKNFGGSSRGYFDALFSVRNCSAVTAACMMIRRDVFELVGGFDEGLAVCYNDVDLCLRVREAGYRVVWTPYAELYHHEMILRGHTINPKEVDYIKARWGEALLRDPYYNDNLTLHGEDFGLRF